MKIFLNLFVAVLFIFTSCSDVKKTTKVDMNGLHKATAEEVLHVKEYSYIRMMENGVEMWIAAPITEIEVGKTYYFGKVMEMKNFESKELNKTFESVYFVEKVSATEASITVKSTPTTEPAQGANGSETSKKVDATKEIKVEPLKDGITIAELFKNKDKYKGQLVKLKGEVTKYNPAIMNVNWFHMQDGTDFNGEFDLTVTTNEEVKIGDVVTLQGKVTLDKDFGAGYFYAIIVEEAVLVK